ncbi:hypothetical protein Plec18167_006426 [Paecilomyces lecythidis]|uniref:Uncharacterized protein n=1 Tax=Paecilomyces lecythidis TaxID=3004212 RepID=A0ABR3XCG6_9EURO
MASASSGRAANKKVKGAPDYDDPGFWDTRFATGQDVGEWLNSGETLIETVLSDLEKRQPIESGSGEQRRPRVLHLGPGVSRLGSKLRDKFVERGWRGDGIVEFESGKEAAHAMHWVRADLRSWSDLSSALMGFSPFDIIMDKSTSDAIATGVDEVFTSSSADDQASVCPTVRQILDRRENSDISLAPVELLALHLVSLTQKGTTWLALSYSTMRFDNFPYLAEYWKVLSRTPLQAPAGQTASSAYTPQIFHWLYILQRV